VSTRLGRAISIAAQRHEGQVDKAGVAYILHPLRVMRRLASYGEDYMIVGVLHDAVEDSKLTLDDVDREFGKVIRDAVDSLTKREGETYEERVQRAARNAIGRQVKIADLSENCDPERMPAVLTREDHARWEKYRTAMSYLLEFDGQRPYPV
jgi:(p)ppGpp synthase/HD superfamily hydrolase